MKFKEFEPGLSVTAGPFVVTEAEILRFAQAYDPLWFHTNREAAKTGRWGARRKRLAQLRRCDAPGI